MSDRKASDGKASDGKISGGKTGRPEKSRFGEQTDIRRGKGKEEKCKEHHSADKQDKWAGFFGALRIPQFPGSPKGCEDSGVEDPDVDQSEIPSEDPRICVKQHRHEPCPEQPSGDAISGLQQTVLRSKTDAMRNDRTLNLKMYLISRLLLKSA